MDHSDYEFCVMHMDNVDYEFCVMHRDHSDGPHRGPWSEQECKAWIEEGLEDGIKEGVFYMACREVGPWFKA